MARDWFTASAITVVCLVLRDLAVCHEILVTARYLHTGTVFHSAGSLTLSRYWLWNCFTTHRLSSSFRQSLFLTAGGKLPDRDNKLVLVNFSSSDLGNWLVAAISGGNAYSAWLSFPT